MELVQAPLIHYIITSLNVLLLIAFLIIVGKLMRRRRKRNANRK
jgi:hypothetical protein